MGDERRRTITGWAAALSITDEPLTMDEARLWAALATYDRTVETLTASQDMQSRLMRLEAWVAQNVPGYDAGTRERLKLTVDVGGDS